MDSVLIVVAPPICVERGGDDIPCAVGIEQGRRIAVLVTGEQRHRGGGVGRKIPVYQPDDILLAKAGNSLMVLWEVSGSAEAGLVFAPAIAPQFAGQRRELVAVLLRRGQNYPALCYIRFQPRAERGRAFQPIQAAGGNEQHGVERGDGGRKIHVQRVVRFAQRVKEGGGFLGEAVPEQGDTGQAAIDWLLITGCWLPAGRSIYHWQAHI